MKPVCWMDENEKTAAPVRTRHCLQASADICNSRRLLYAFKGESKGYESKKLNPVHSPEIRRLSKPQRTT